MACASLDVAQDVLKLLGAIAVLSGAMASMEKPWEKHGHKAPFADAKILSYLYPVIAFERFISTDSL